MWQSAVAINDAAYSRWFKWVTMAFQACGRLGQLKTHQLYYSQRNAYLFTSLTAFWEPMSDRTYHCRKIMYNSTFTSYRSERITHSENHSCQSPACRIISEFPTAMISVILWKDMSTNHGQHSCKTTFAESYNLIKSNISTNRMISAHLKWALHMFLSGLNC